MVHVWVKLCNPTANAGHILERFRDEILYNKVLYKSILLYFTFNSN